MNEARIEAAAKALYKEVHGLNHWEDELDAAKDLFRSDIRMAVSAWLKAGPPVYEHDGEPRTWDGFDIPPWEALQNCIEWGMVEVKSDE